jgi:hypothetical protein
MAFVPLLRGMSSHPRVSPHGLHSPRYLVLNDVVEGDQTGSKRGPDETDEGQSALAADQAHGGAPGNDRAVRRLETERILVDAAQRDNAATARDVISDQREMVADLKDFLDRDESYAGLEDRRAAALDRSLANGDREASAQDRAELTKPDPEPHAGNRSSEAQ